jgi:hypothetical protein
MTESLLRSSRGAESKRSNTSVKAMGAPILFVALSPIGTAGLCGEGSRESQSADRKQYISTKSYKFILS